MGYEGREVGLVGLVGGRPYEMLEGGRWIPLTGGRREVDTPISFMISTMLHQSRSIINIFFFKKKSWNY